MLNKILHFTLYPQETQHLYTQCLRMVFREILNLLFGLESTINKII